MTSHVFSVTSKCKSICVMWVLGNRAIFFNSYYISFHPQYTMKHGSRRKAGEEGGGRVGGRWGKAAITHVVVAPTQYYSTHCSWYDCNSTVAWHFKQCQHVLCDCQPPCPSPFCFPCRAHLFTDGAAYPWLQQLRKKRTILGMGQWAFGLNFSQHKFQHELIHN